MRSAIEMATKGWARQAGILLARMQSPPDHRFTGPHMILE